MSEKLYKIEKNDEKYHVYHPYSSTMNITYRRIGAKWKKNCWVVPAKSFEIVNDELKCFFGMPEDVAVDLILEIDSVKIINKFVVAGRTAISVNVLEKQFSFVDNVHIYKKRNFDGWEKVEGIRYSNTHYLFSKLFFGFFKPFKLQNCKLRICNISRVRAQEYLESKPKGIKKVSIENSEHNVFSEAEEKYKRGKYYR